MNKPQSTYRIQFSGEFPFSRFKDSLSFLYKLGISTIYASPVFRSVRGSTHGYDGLDPHHIDEEIGTREQLGEIAEWLREHNQSWLQDIVPNHMAYSPANAWIFNLFEWGEDSPYYHYFDVNWNHPDADLSGKVMLPVLGDQPKKLIRSGEISLKFKESGFCFSYYDQALPLCARMYPDLLNEKDRELPEAFTSFLKSMSLVIQNKQTGEWAACKDELHALYLNNPQVHHHIGSVLSSFNDNPDRKTALLEQQYYRLSHWMETSHRINFRRFFTINGLICLRMEDPAVFRDYHSEIKKLMDEGVFQGLRVDHADGLFHPREYLNRLRELTGPDAYIITEKILEAEETLPRAWPVEGTSGYDFLSLVNNLLTNEQHEKEFETVYQMFGGEEAEFDELVYEKKKFILLERMHGDLDNLTHLFFELSLDLQPVTPEDVEAVLTEFLVLCPVYKIYPESFPLKGRNKQLLSSIFEDVRQRVPQLGVVIGFFESLFSMELPEAAGRKPEIEFFFRRCMQFTGPVMAKGVEDTSFYTYGKFIAHNEVGDSPEHFGISLSDFHARIRERFKYYPLTMNATATHDTKRGEDSRARLLVLSDLPDQWKQAVSEWKELNAGQKPEVNGQSLPFLKDEYFIYQSLTGAYPLDPEEEKDFPDRFMAFITKALREAKENSSWFSPNEEYERATLRFIRSLLHPDMNFLPVFRKFLFCLTDFGIINSICQLMLKHTCPGVPDTYQGCELWDFSMVDPDNRRPVDYEKRDRWLTEIKESVLSRDDLFRKLWEERLNGKIKLAVTAFLLEERKRYPHVFQYGKYIPLSVTGKYKDQVLAFLRQHEQINYLVVLPVHLAAVLPDAEKLSSFDWKDTSIDLPSGLPREWEHLFSGINKTGFGAKVLLRDIFTSYMPFSILRGD